MTELTEKQVLTYLQKNEEFAKKFCLHFMASRRSGGVEESRPELSEAGDLGRHTPMPSDEVENILQERRQRRSTLQLQTGTNRDELTLELITDLANELEVDRFCHKILLHVTVLIHGQRSSLFLMKGKPPNQYLVSKLFDVTGSSSLQDALHTEDKQFSVSLEHSIAGEVALTKKAINLPDAYKVSHRKRSTF